METKNLKVNQISVESFDWYKKYLATIDKKDVGAYGAFLAEGCVMVQNNQPPVVGKQAILAGLGQYWKSFASLTHDLLNIYGQDDAFMLEAYNHYVRLDGNKVSVRAVALTERNLDGLVTSFRFYTDVSPVFASEA